MNAVTRQKGVSPVGAVLGLAILGFVLSVGLKIGPHYLDFWAVKKVMDNAGQGGEKIDSASDYFQHVQRGLQVNGISDLDLKQVLSVAEQGGSINAHLNYEKREHLVSNVDLILVFNHDASVTAQ